jgi:hypothetical protein
MEPAASVTFWLHPQQHRPLQPALLLLLLVLLVLLMGLCKHSTAMAFL